jgi:hypothetical protein
VTEADVTSIEHAIDVWRENLIDLDIQVVDARHVVDAALEHLREAVRERDAAARHLAGLVAWRDEDVA